jgi:D-serine deaminase-like pyridoxal phosphate-dependent protein
MKKSHFIKIEKPTVLIQKRRAIHNIERMISKSKMSNTRFRPHFKTHQSSLIGKWFRELDVTQITVSSVEMAQYFSDHGWKDITIAFPCNILELPHIRELARKAKLNLLIESEEVFHQLNQKLDQKVDIWIKVDIGSHRTGILWHREEEILHLAKLIEISQNFQFAGILSHAGHTYKVKGSENIRRIYQEMIMRLSQVKRYLQSNGLIRTKVSIGDTPSNSIINSFPEVDEIRPGNFIFYDIMQLQIGSCSEEDIALGVACPVVAQHPSRREIVIYGGAVHLSKEFISQEDGSKNFGLLAPLHSDGWGNVVPESYLCSLSQEHGIIKASHKFFSDIKIGDVIVVLPIHSCLVMNLLKNRQLILHD